MRSVMLAVALLWPTPTNANSTATAAWACIRHAESGDDYTKATGYEPFGGAYQFSLVTWRFLGFRGLPSQASPSTQDRAALKEYAWAKRYKGNPWQPWPESSLICGLDEHS